MKFLNKKNKGFTLIELLVVIAIIGVLSSVVLASLNSSRVKAREAKRMSDINQIDKAIQMYISDHDAAPYIEDFGDDPITDRMIGWEDLGSKLSPYLKTMPQDPLSDISLGNDYTHAYQYYNPKDSSSIDYGLGVLKEKGESISIGITGSI